MGTNYSPEEYNERWYTNRQKFHPYIEAILQPIINRYGEFDSALDLGAGDGWYAHVLSDDSVAVELNPSASKVIPDDVTLVVHDLRQPLNLERLFDVVVCIEVAEHLPETAEEALCNSIAKHTGNLLLFSAAPPGQPGKRHINCKQFDHWKQMLEARGLEYCEAETKEIRKEWKAILGENMKWLPKNIRILKRQG